MLHIPLNVHIIYESYERVYIETKYKPTIKYGCETAGMGLDIYLVSIISP